MQLLNGAMKRRAILFLSLLVVPEIVEAGDHPLVEMVHGPRGPRIGELGVLLCRAGPLGGPVAEGMLVDREAVSIQILMHVEDNQQAIVLCPLSTLLQTREVLLINVVFLRHQMAPRGEHAQHVEAIGAPLSEILLGMVSERGGEWLPALRDVEAAQKHPAAVMIEDQTVFSSQGWRDWTRHGAALALNLAVHTRRIGITADPTCRGTVTGAGEEKQQRQQVQ